MSGHPDRTTGKHNILGCGGAVRAACYANSDSGGGAYTDVAIDQADRAVKALLRS
jgi:hypothetical protein